MDIGVLPSCVGYVIERYITYNNRIYSICNIKYILYTVYIESGGFRCHFIQKKHYSIYS